MFAIAAVALVLFVVWERHREKVQRAALLDLNLFSFSTFSWGNLTAAMVGVGEFAIIFVLPLYLINALGIDVMGAGLVLAAMALGAFFSGASARHVEQSDSRAFCPYASWCAARLHSRTYRPPRVCDGGSRSPPRRSRQHRLVHDGWPRHRGVRHRKRHRISLASPGR